MELLGDPSFNLAEPGTFVFDGRASTRGLQLNRFALSLKNPANRRNFLSDETAYMKAYGLQSAEQALVTARDWTGMLRAGGHLQAILKLAATLGLNLYHIGAHNTGSDFDTIFAACPRRVSSLDGLHG